MTDATRAQIMRAFLSKEGLALVRTQRDDGSTLEGEDLTRALLEIADLSSDIEIIEVEDAYEQPNAWDDAVTLEYPAHVETGLRALSRLRL